jgi:hypothetical protein
MEKELVEDWTKLGWNLITGYEPVKQIQDRYGTLRDKEIKKYYQPTLPDNNF